MPTRSTNNMDSTTTRINEVSATFATAPKDFAAPSTRPTALSPAAPTRSDLTPTLWWDTTGKGASLGVSGGGVFPTDASGGPRRSNCHREQSQEVSLDW